MLFKTLTTTAVCTAACYPASISTGDLPMWCALVLLIPRFGRPLFSPSNSWQALHTAWLLMYPHRLHFPGAVRA